MKTWTEVRPAREECSYGRCRGSTREDNDEESVERRVVLLRCEVPEG